MCSSPRQPRDLLRALVSGLAEPRRGNRLFLMLQSFIDDFGWDGRAPVFVLAGYVAKEQQWEVFSDDWQIVLDLPEPKKLHHLKMAEAYLLNNRNSQFYGWTEKERDERLKKFVQVINRHAAHGVISVIPIEPYRRLFAGKFSPDILDRPYFLSFFGMMTNLIKFTKDRDLDDRIDFIFDTQGGESKAILVSQYERYMALAPAEFRKFGPAIPKFEREEDFLPLQAADMFAWHIRRHYWEVSIGRDPTKQPSNVFLAHLLQPDHDLFDLWDEQRLKEASEVLLASVKKPRHV